VYCSILLGLADGEALPDPDVQKAALNVIINSVCGPMSRVNYAVCYVLSIIFLLLSAMVLSSVSLFCDKWTQFCSFKLVTVLCSLNLFHGLRSTGLKCQSGWICIFLAQIAILVVIKLTRNIGKFIVMYGETV